MARSRKDIFAGSRPSTSMSAMIDLVFLLLIFFMVASKMITAPQIEGLEIPIASTAKVPRDATGRVVVNINRDGVLLDATGKRELTPFDLQQMVARAKSANPRARLLIRADQGVPHKYVKEAMKASAEGGVTDIIYSTYITGK